MGLTKWYVLPDFSLVPKNQFTAENAAEMQRRSRDAIRALDSPPAPDVRRIRARVSDIEEWIRDELNKPERASRVLDELTRSAERMFKIWAYLAGLPGPGNRKPSAERGARRMVNLTPLGPVPAEPVEPPALPVVDSTEQLKNADSGVDTTIQSVPEKSVEPETLQESK